MGPFKETEKESIYVSMTEKSKSRNLINISAL